MCHRSLLFSSSFGEVMPVQLCPGVFCGVWGTTHHLTAWIFLGIYVQWSSWRQTCSAVLFSCSTEQQLWQFSSAMRLQLFVAARKAQGGKQDKDCSLPCIFPAEFSLEIIFPSYPGNTVFKADRIKQNQDVSRSILSLIQKLYIMRCYCSKWRCNSAGLASHSLLASFLLELPWCLLEDCPF